MVRWITAGVLLACALLTAWAGLSRTTERGLTLKRYDNRRWKGDPVEQKHVQHVNYGPKLRMNRLQLPDDSSMLLEGFLFAPRRGSYEFAASSSDNVYLRVSNKTVFSHKGAGRKDESGGSVQLAKGFHSIRLQIRHKTGESWLRLKWRLPSGYMNLEPLPPVFLHPALPAQGSPVPAAMRVGPFILLMLAFLVVIGPRLTRGLRMLRGDVELRRKVLVGAVLVVSTIGYRSWDLNGAGETSDEWAYAAAGRIYVANAAHGYFQSGYWNSNEEHPPIGKYVYGLVSHVVGNDDYGPLRMASATMAGLTVLITFLFALRFFGLWVAGISGLILVLMPHFVAHGKVAALDSPSAFLFTASVYLFARALFEVKVRNARFLLAGVVAALAFATKFSNVLVFIFMVVVHFASQWRNMRKKGIVELPIALGALPLLPFIVLLCVWPWLWREPFGQLLVTLKHWDYPIQEWFLGRFRQPPWYYFPVYFVATTPSLLLIPFGAFFVHAWRRRSFPDLFVLLWFLTPFIWTVSVLKQDGVRYIYNMYPPLALMMAIGVTSFVRSIRWRSVISACAAVYLLISGWLVHPYYLDYYSEAVGGTDTAFEKSWFEVGWWGEGQAEAYRYLNEHAGKGATYDVIGMVNHTADVLRPDMAYRQKKPDFLVRNYLTPSELAQDGYVEVFRVSVDNAPIVVVYVREDLTATPPPDRPAATAPK